MQKFIIVIALLGFAIGCSPDGGDLSRNDPYTVDLSHIEGISTQSSVSAKIMDLKGGEILDASQFIPNTEYKILFTSSDVGFIRIRNSDGFTVIDHRIIDKNQIEYSIRTSSAFADLLYVNVVPIREIDNKLLRERPQVFLLPQ